MSDDQYHELIGAWYVVERAKELARVSGMAEREALEIVVIAANEGRLPIQ